MRRRGDFHLGELERAVMDVLWTRDAAGAACDVKAVHGAVGAARGIAYNTVQSTLERLSRKGLAERTKAGRAFRYRPALSRRAWVARTLDALLDGVPGRDPELLLAAFVDVAARVGAESLEELERLVRERRRRALEKEGEDT